MLQSILALMEPNRVPSHFDLSLSASLVANTDAKGGQPRSSGFSVQCVVRATDLKPASMIAQLLSNNLSASANCACSLAVGGSSVGSPPLGCVLVLSGLGPCLSHAPALRIAAPVWIDRNRAADQVLHGTPEWITSNDPRLAASRSLSYTVSLFRSP